MQKTNRLLELIAQNDHDAFTQFVKQWESKIRCFIRSKVHNHHLAEDLTQECLLIVYRKAHTHNPSRNGNSWVMTIAHNLALQKRKPRKRQDVTATDCLANREHDLDDVVGRESREELEPEVTTLLNRRVRQLNRSRQEVIRLVFWEDMNYEHAAAKMSTSLNTTKTRIFDALHALRREYGLPYIKR